MKPLTAHEVEQMIYTLSDPQFDEEAEHARYDEILERYCLYPDPALSELMKELILKVRPKVLFWYA